MRYRDSFGEVKKVRLSFEDYNALKDAVSSLAGGIKSLAEAMITEYELKKEKHEKNAANSGEESLDDYCASFEIYVPEFLKGELKKIADIKPSLEDFIEQF